MKTLLSVIRWVFGLFFGMGAIGGFMSGDIIAALFVLTIALLLLPPVTKALFRNRNSFRNISQGKGVSVVPTAATAPVMQPMSKAEQAPKFQKPSVREVNRYMNERSRSIVDSSIIDVTGQSYRIPDQQPKSAISESDRGVPYWAHQYVYSYAELNSASAAQSNFYQRFKASFLNGVYLDLEGNTNYAFILLFDLLNKDYEKHKDIEKLEGQLDALGEHYPKTRSYANSFLIQKMEAAGDIHGVDRRRMAQYSHYSYQSSYDQDQWKLGTQYKAKLGLAEDEISLLNKLWNPGNTFCNNEFCLVEVMKLYLATLKIFESQCILESTTLEQEFKAVADVVARKYFKYRSNSNNYKYSLGSVAHELYTTVFKHCENAVREHYSHKRKVSTETVYHSKPEVAAVFEEKITSRINAILPKLLPSVSIPDIPTEIELNAQNTGRWKTKFEELTINFKARDGKQFIQDIIQLGEYNKKNPSLENIFFEASKFIAKTDREAALVLYVHYLYHDLHSATFNNKQLAKTLQKNLFQTEQQLTDFTTIIQELIQGRDLEKAVGAVAGIFTPKRKKIELNRAAINEVQQQHAGTVELLNDYLQEEEEPQQNAENVGVENLGEGEVTFENLLLQAKGSDGFFIEEVLLNDAQCELLQLFASNSFTIAQQEVEAFARMNNLMRNQLIDSINECCYEQLDDVLIEEDGEYYTIYENYFQQLIKK
ncbi:hypothetical protein DXT99_20095 [Pontibacter diazotrophicus]|uniref:TerB-C domain-containing protein n=1 Tax=Pontibacter diazotrophicus TaxID=1400979 RepID=A0A3D8L8K7_9BACT|nr:tellurite resistance TerB C-terminal domain-containing protein [Pontibacter diazotrophicus]RDV13322.1 hypothetical protein DXT99_20095 [Pontibacter diazotrophicus]